MRNLLTTLAEVARLWLSLQVRRLDTTQLTKALEDEKEAHYEYLKSVDDKLHYSYSNYLFERLSIITSIRRDLQSRLEGTVTGIDRSSGPLGVAPPRRESPKDEGGE
jgi:hypothetical protein